MEAEGAQTRAAHAGGVVGARGQAAARAAVASAAPGRPADPALLEAQAARADAGVARMHAHQRISGAAAGLTGGVLGTGADDSRVEQPTQAPVVDSVEGIPARSAAGAHRAAGRARPAGRAPSPR